MKAEPTTHTINRMKADDPRLVTKYNKLSMKTLKAARVKEELQALSIIPCSKWEDAHADKYNYLILLARDVRK
jgi:hypothetical protein